MRDHNVFVSSIKFHAVSSPHYNCLFRVVLMGVLNLCFHRERYPRSFISVSLTVDVYGNKQGNMHIKMVWTIECQHCAFENRSINSLSCLCDQSLNIKEL